LQKLPNLYQTVLEGEHAGPENPQKAWSPLLKMGDPGRSAEAFKKKRKT